MSVVIRLQSHQAIIPSPSLALTIGDKSTPVGDHATPDAVVKIALFKPMAFDYVVAGTSNELHTTAVILFGVPALKP